MGLANVLTRDMVIQWKAQNIGFGRTSQDNILAIFLLGIKNPPQNVFANKDFRNSENEFA